MSVQNPNIVELARLETGHYDFDFQLDSTFLTVQEKTELLGGLVHVHASLNLRQDDCDLTIGLNGKVQVTCDRCLDAMDVDIVVEEAIEVEENEKVLNLEWLAYELIIIHLPLVHCHPEGGCNPEMIALLQSHLCRTEEEPEDNNKN